MRKFTAYLAAFLAVFNQAQAQTYDSGAGVTPSWSLTPTNPVGSAPADANEPADVADSGFTESQWITTGDQLATDKAAASHDYYKRTVDGGTGTTPVGEKKVRILCEPGTAKQVDPILGLGVTPYGHRHQGIGNVGWGESSTFATLRASPSSTCSGGPLNGVIYWEPEFIKSLSSGVLAGMRPQNATFYYINGLQTEANVATWLRRNFAFIGGQNPANFNNQTLRNEYSAAGLEWPGSPSGVGQGDSPGFQGYACYAGTDLNTAVTVSRTASRVKTATGTEQTVYARHLVAEDGSDPWGGSCTGTNALPGSIILNLGAPDCWDRTNLRSPDGRSHVRYSTRKSDNSVTNLCPDGWAHIPALQAKTEFFHTGFSDYGTWYLSSDRMNAVGTAADTSSYDPCRRVSAYYCNGATAHFDWMFGWKSAIIDEWERECLGITVRGVAPTDGPAECNTSQISRSRKLLNGGASPNSAMSGGCTTMGSCSNAVPGNLERYNPVVAGTTGPFVLHGH